MKNIHNKKKPIVKNKNTLAYPCSTLDPPISIINQAEEIEKAGKFIKDSVNHKLDVILKQIKNLQDEAREIISKANEDMRLHGVDCKFVKKPGDIVYLYEDDRGKLYFSKLSPADWDNNPPNKYLDAFKINLDNGFDKIT